MNKAQCIVCGTSIEFIDAHPIFEDDVACEYCRDDAIEAEREELEEAKRYAALDDLRKLSVEEGR